MKKLVAGFGLLYLALVIAAAAGWILNLIALIHSVGGITAMFILRIVGLFVFPLGCLLGYL